MSKDGREWSIRVFRMTVADDYRTPWCAWAERRDGTLVLGMNAEGRTPEDARRRIEAKIKKREIGNERTD